MRPLFETLAHVTLEFAQRDALAARPNRHLAKLPAADDLFELGRPDAKNFLGLASLQKKRMVFRNMLLHGRSILRKPLAALDMITTNVVLFFSNGKAQS